MTGRLWSFFGLIVQASQVLISIERHLRLGKSWGNFVNRRLGENWGSNIQGLRPIRDTAFSHCAANDRQHHGVQQLLRQKVEETDRWPDGGNGVFRSKSPALRKWKSGPITMNCGQLGGTQAKPMKKLATLGRHRFLQIYSSPQLRNSTITWNIWTPNLQSIHWPNPQRRHPCTAPEQGFLELNWCKKKRSTNLQVFDTKFKSSSLSCFGANIIIYVQKSDKTNQRWQNNPNQVGPAGGNSNRLVTTDSFSLEPRNQGRLIRVLACQCQSIS